VIPRSSSKKQHESRSPSAERRRKPYEHRRATDSLVSSGTRPEGRMLTVCLLDGFAASSMTFTKRTFPFLQPSPRSPKPSSPAMSTLSPGRQDSKKKPPRTVHIDVYCTGSEVETSTSNSSSPNICDDFGNLMGQATVIESEDMLLKHRRIIGKGEMPRKLANGD